MPVFEDPGIIRLELGDQILTTHYRDELFEDGPLAIASGSVTLSNGFAASLAADIDAGAGYAFEIEELVQLDIIDSYANVKALALVMEQQGLDVSGLFGDGGVGITLRDSAENIQAALLEPGLGLLANIASVELILEDGEEPPPVRVPLDKYDPDLDWSAFASVTVFGTLEDYLQSPLNLTDLGLADPPLFVVEDSLAAFTTAVEDDLTPSSGNLAVVASSDFRINDTVDNLNNAFGDLYETSFDGAFSTYGVLDTLANVDTASSGGDLAVLNVQTIVLVDSAANLGAGGAIDPSEIDGVRVVDTADNLLLEDFSSGYLPGVTEVIVQDTAEEIADLLGTPIEGPVTFAAGAVLNGIDVISAVDPLSLSFTDILSLELSSLVASDSALRVEASIAELTHADNSLGSGASILDRFETLNGTALYGVDTALQISGFLPTIDSLQGSVKDALTGFDLVEDTVFPVNSLYINAAYVSEDAAVKAAAEITDRQLEFNALDATTSIDLFGSAAVIADAANFGPGTYVNNSAAALGDASVQVYDGASAIRDAATDLAARDDSDADKVFTIDGITTRFTHVVEYEDIYAAGADTLLGTLDDDSISLSSFAWAEDWYLLGESVFDDGLPFTVTVEIDGAFDVEFNGVADVVDISVQTGSFDNDINPANDFAFVEALNAARYDAETDSFGTVDGKPAIDIAISEPESTLIEFDGLVGSYDGAADFEIYLPDAALAGSRDSSDNNSDGDFTDLKNGITALSFFGIPLIDQITGDGFFDPTVFPTLELLRFEGVDVFASAPQVFDILNTRFYDDPGIRNEEVNRLFNLDGDILLGDEGGLGGPTDDNLLGDGRTPLVDDVMFGLAGADSLDGLTGDDYLHGGDGADTLYGREGADTLVGGDGNDMVYAGDDNDLLVGGAGNDALDGEGDEDTVDYSATYLGVSVDLDAGTASGAEIDNDTLTNIENVEGGSGNDSLTGDVFANTLVGNDGADDLDGGEGNDVIIGGEGADTLTGGGGQDLFSYALLEEFGDTITDFEIQDSIEIHRSALPGGASFKQYGTDAGLLTSSDIVFALQASTPFAGTPTSGFNGHAFAEFGDASDIRTLTPDAQDSVPVFFSLAGSALTFTYYDSSFAQAFINDLTGLFAPTEIFLSTYKPTAFTTTASGALQLNSTLTPEAAFTGTTVAGRFVAFGMVNNTSEGAGSSALVMAYINNGPAGQTTVGGLNEITAAEVSAFTIAVFDPAPSAAAITGDVLLV